MYAECVPRPKLRLPTQKRDGHPSMKRGSTGVRILNGIFRCSPHDGEISQRDRPSVAPWCVGVLVQWCILTTMARLTITLPDSVHRDLKIRAASTGSTIGELIQEGLEARKELARRRVIEFTASARAHAAETEPRLNDDEIMDLAVAETHAVREERAAGRAVKRGA